MRSMFTFARRVLPALMLIATSVAAPAAAAPKASKSPKTQKAKASQVATPAFGLEDAARSFESAQVLAGASKLEALEHLDRSLPRVIEAAEPADRAAAPSQPPSTQFVASRVATMWSRSTCASVRADDAARWARRVALGR